MPSAPPPPLSAPPLSGAERQALINAARAARDQAYVPVSRFQVGAAVLDAEGRIHPGCNIEMPGEGGLCAEGVAVASAITSGAHFSPAGLRFVRAVAVSKHPDAQRGRESPTTSTPCGVCRQVLNDFSIPDPGAEVVLDDGSAEGFLFSPLSALLPYAFVFRADGEATPLAPLCAQADCDALEREAEADPRPEALGRVAEKIRANAAAHTRHQPEGAVILTQDGRAFCGVSVENSNTNLYFRALPVALYRAVLAGVRPPFARTLALASAHPSVSPALLETFAVPDYVLEMGRGGVSHGK